MPDFQFASSVLLRHPLPEVFAFFARAENLELMTPPWLRFAILEPRPTEMRAGTVISYRIRLRGVPVRWESEITEWNPPHGFTDTQRRGPYRLWIHRHRFEETPQGTLAADEVTYRPPGGEAAGLINRLFVAAELRKIFAYRQAKMLELFPD